MQNPIKMDGLGVPLFLETPIYMELYYPIVWGLKEPIVRIPIKQASIIASKKCFFCVAQAL